IQLEKVLIDKKNFQLLLEKFLIVIRKISNCRGRKANAQASAEAPEINRDNKRYKGDNRESGGGSASATPCPPPCPSSEQTSYSHKPEVSAEVPEQPELPEVTSGPPCIPDAAAKWCAKTAVALSEFLRGKRYTSDQQPNQLRAAQKMFKTFPDLTRAQFDAAF